MGRNRPDTTDTHSTAEQQESLPVESEKVSPTSLESTKRQERAPDPRRRVLIAGLATTPILLTLMNRSALAQDINCSALASVILGGSAANLPPGLLNGEGGDNNNVSPEVLQKIIDARCNGNASGNANGNANGNTSDNASCCPKP
jgi:hypothetical protein